MVARDLTCLQGGSALLFEASHRLGILGKVARMPIEFGLWRIDGAQERIVSSPMASEARLEDMLAADISILDLDVMVIGRQFVTDFGGRLDLLAINSAGELHLFELKRDKTPRDIVAQTLDYASWVADLSYDRVQDIFAAFKPGTGLGKSFADRFQAPLPDPINTQQHLYIVASELDASTERIVTFLNTRYAVPLNAIFFRYLVDDGREYIARTWLIDPRIAEAQQVRTGTNSRRPPWNGEDFYVSVGEGPHRNWDDFVKYGFVSGGGGRWYSRTLGQLKPGNRAFACIPGRGYVGVGEVVGLAVPISEFFVAVDGRDIPLLDLPLKAPSPGEFASDPELSEYVVPIRWLVTRPRENAIWKAGMFANQNTACGLRDPFTLEQLRESFPVMADT